MTSAACFVSGGAAPGAALQALLEKEPLSLSSIELICGEQHPPHPVSSSESKFNVVLAASTSSHSRDALVRVARAMAPGGRLYVYEAAEAAPSGSQTRLEALTRDLLLSGFTDAQALDGTGLSASAADVPAVWVFAQMPSWGLGAAAKLSLKRPAAAPAPPAAAEGASTATAATAAPTTTTTWKLAAGDGMEDEEEEELVDEDTLLTAEEKRAAPAPKPDDCEVGQSGRKACKNCSCGRAEAEADAAAGGGGGGVKLTADMLDNPQSACGNCYLGDAFRCGSCPYRGLPAFQPGEKITLGASLLAADV